MSSIEGSTNEPGAVRRKPRAPAWIFLLGGLLAAAAVYPFDAAVFAFVRDLPIGGDVRRELEVIQQFGAPVSLALMVWAVWLTMPGRRHLIGDGVLAGLAVWGTSMGLKLLLGRARPRDSVLEFYGSKCWLGPQGVHTTEGGGFVDAWEFWERGASDFWAMPSSHSSMAFFAAVWLWRVNPRLGPLVFTLAACVPFARVFFGAHWPSDTLVGMGLGAGLAILVMDACERRRRRRQSPA